MKYTFESTEAETLACIGLIERMFSPIAAVLGEMAKDMAARPRAAEPEESALASAEAPEAFAATTPGAASAPVPASQPAETQRLSSFGVPIPETKAQPKVDLPTLTPEKREAAWASFRAFCHAWVQGFGIADAEQPDRQKLMEELGSGQNVVAVLIMAYEIESLQRLVEKALFEAGVEWDGSAASWVEWVDQVSATMVQISHQGFPELAGTYDFTQRWRRQK